jgi:hypothetical protein
VLTIFSKTRMDRGWRLADLLAGAAG